MLQSQIGISQNGILEEWKLRKHPGWLRSFALLATLAFFTGCAVVSTARKSSSKMAHLSVGQKRSDVLKVLGNPKNTASWKQGDGSTLREDLYFLFPPGQVYLQAIMRAPLGWFKEDPAAETPWWVYYVNGTLTQWTSPNPLKKTE